jgi:hypothetical protein
MPYPPEVFEAILQRLADGEHLAAICRDDGLPDRRTVLRKVRDDPDFAEEYQLARTAAAHGFDQQASDLVDSIKDKDSAQAARAKFEILRWRAGVHAPRVFGEKIGVDVGVSVDISSLVERRRQQAIEATQRLGISGPEGDEQ